MKKKRKLKGLVIAIVIVVLAAGGAAGFFLLRPKAPAASSQLFTAAQVTRGDIEVTVHGSGSIEAMDTHAVNAGTAGKVKEVLVEDGDAVKKGQLLARLDDSEVNDTIDTLKEDIITQDATIAALRNATGSTSIAAPIASRVKAIYTKVDEDVNVAMSADNALMLLSTDGKMKVQFVPEQGAGIKAGQAVQLAIGSATANGFITTVPDGTTDEAEAVIDDDSYDIGAKATVKDGNGKTLGSGTLEVNRPLLVTAYSGTVSNIYVDVGDEVSRNKKLIKLDGAVLGADFEAQIIKRQQLQDDLDQAYADKNDLNISAPADGVISDLAVQENSSVQEGAAICNVQDTTSFKLVIAVDELDIPNIKPGQKAAVKIDALPNATAEGEVIKISPLGVKENDITTYDVTLKVTSPAGALANMTSSADIIVNSKQNVLLVPVEAIRTINGKTYVYGAAQGDLPSAGSFGNGGNNSGSNGNRANRMTGGVAGMFGGNNSRAAGSTAQHPLKEVKVGLTSDSYAEILEGLSENDQIAVPVSSSNASGAFGMMGGGMMGAAPVQRTYTSGSKSNDNGNNNSNSSSNGNGSGGNR